MNTLTSKKWLPCPFCGDRDIRSRHVGHTDGWVIECHSCPCELSFFTSETEAWAAWNKRPSHETLSALDAEFFHALDRCDTQEPLKVYDSNSWRRIGLANSYKTVVYPETQKYDGHLNIANTGVLCALVAAFNAMLARRHPQNGSEGT